MSEDARRYAAEMELDAKRYLGEAPAKQPKTDGGRPPKTTANVAEVCHPTSCCTRFSTSGSREMPQKIASIPEDEYQQFKANAPVDRLTTNQVIRLAM